MQTTRAQPHTEAIVHQHLQARAAPICEELGMMRPALAEDAHDPRRGRVQFGAHVEWLDGKPRSVNASHLSRSRTQPAHAVAA